MSLFFAFSPRLLLLSTWLVVGSVSLLADEASQALPTVKLSPAVRAAEPNPFSSIPCDRLHAARARSEREKAQLYQRKQQCLRHYQQFSPGRLAPDVSNPAQGGRQ